MSLDNLISVDLSEAEINAMEESIIAIENSLKGKAVNLTPEDRQNYGRLGNRTENWIERVVGYIDQKPELTPMYINVQELKRDLEARKSLKRILIRLNSLTESVGDTTVLLGTDVYNYALAYYRNLKLVSRENVPGTTEIYQDLAEQFPGRKSAVPEEPYGLPDSFNPGEEM